jgi:hypothetical protein
VTDVVTDRVIECRISAFYAPEPIHFAVAAITAGHRIPHRIPSVSTSESIGFSAGNHWFPTWKPMDSAAKTTGFQRALLKHAPTSVARKARKKWGKMHRVTDYHTSITLSVTTSVTNQTSYHPMSYVRLVTE